MESLQSSFLSSTTLSLPSIKPYQTLIPKPYKTLKPLKTLNPKPKPKPKPSTVRCSSLTPDPWSMSSGCISKPKPFTKNPKNPLSDDNVRRIIKERARYLSALRRNQGPQVRTPNWIKRSPEQMVQYLQDDRNGHLYGNHVVAAIKTVRSLSHREQGGYDMRKVMASFVAKLTFRDMCVVLKEQKGWRQVRDFFDWMKLQLCYHPSVVAYTIVLRTYGQVGKIKLAEETFLEMLDAGCEPDEIACGTMLCTYARWGRHKAMLSFYSAVQERRVVFSVAVYNFMMSSLQKRSLHGDVVKIFQDMTDKGVVPNPFTFSVGICSMVKEGLLEEGLATFDRMKSLGFLPEEVTYSHLITSCVKGGKQDSALRIYQDMRSRGLVPSNFTCSSLLNLYYKNGDYSKALSLFSEMERYKIPADELIYGLLIRIYGKLGLYEDAERTFEEAKRLGLLRDEKTYTTMAQVHLNSGNFVKALKVIKLMRTRSILFSRFAYTIMLRCFVMKGDLAVAEMTFQSLSKTGFPDSISCNDMLKLYARVGLLEKAKSLIMNIRKENVVVDEELCRTMMKVYSKEGMLVEVERLMKEYGEIGSLKNSGFFQTISIILNAEVGRFERGKYTLIAPGLPDTNALEFMLNLYLEIGNSIKAEWTLDCLLETPDGLTIANQLIHKFIREGDASKAETLYDLLTKRGSKPEGGVLASMINLYGKQQKLEKVNEMVSTMDDPAVYGSEMYNSMIEACANCGELVKAFLLYKECRDKRIAMSPTTISVLVNKLTSHGMHEEAKNVINRSFHDDVVLDTIAYNTFIKAMLEAGKLHFAARIYERMLSKGVSTSIQTYNTMISVYGRQRNLDKAKDMFDLAHTIGVPLDEKLYTNLIGLYGKAGRAQEASELFVKMQEGGINPGKISYNVMINVYGTAGLDTEAEDLFQAMQKAGYQPDSVTYLALIRAYTQRMKHSEAEQTLISMRKQGIQPSCAHFNLLMSAFAKAGLIKEARTVFENMLDSGTKPDLVCHRTVLRGYMDCGSVEDGVSFFEKIQGSVEKDRFIMSAAVHLYRAAGQDHQAEALLSCMSDLGIPFLKELPIGSKMRTT